MRVFVDYTEPGAIFQKLIEKTKDTRIRVDRTILHKRAGLGASAIERHPFYGLGADYLVTDDDLLPAVAIERKTYDDLAKSITLVDRGRQGGRIFRQLTDLQSHPTPILLLEGPHSILYRRVEAASLGIQFWCAKQGIALMTTSSPEATAHAIFLMARKLGIEWESAPAEVEAALETAKRAPEWSEREALDEGGD